MSASKQRLYLRLQLAAHRLQKVADRDLLKSSGLTTAQAGVLAIVASSSRVTQKDVAIALGFNESAITAMVNRLINSGHLTRDCCEEDKRVRLLCLTDLGKSALENTKAPFRRINQLIDGKISNEEVKELVDRLNRIINLFDE